MNTTYHVGPIGGLVALPDVLGDRDQPLERIGGSSRSLLGRQWRDTLGFQRSWSWSWDALLPEQVAAVEPLAYGVMPGPIRLLDPYRANRLPEQVASGGSVTRSARLFAVTTGGVQYRALRLAGPNPLTLGPWRLLRGCQQWLRPTAGDGVLYLPGNSLDGTWRLPVLPGERLRLSVWLAGQSGVQPRLGWVEYDRNDAPTAYQTPNGLGINSSTWQRGTTEFVPGASTVAVSPRITLPAGSVAGSVFVTALSLGPLDAEARPGALDVLCDLDDPGDGWRIGGGAAEVIPEPNGGGISAAPGLRKFGLTLVETAPY
jgi:hypothetical protein